MATTIRRIRPLTVLPILWLALGHDGSVLAQDKPVDPPSQQAAACDGTAEECVAEGVGPTKKDAQRDALRKAIAMSVRNQVDSNEMDKQKGVIEAKVLSEADWVVVESAEAAKPFTRDGVSHVTVRAKICVSRLKKVLVKNSIKVREVDLQTIQEDSSQLADRSRNVAEIAADVFRGFPTSMMQAELLEEVRIGGDDKFSIVEVPARVWIDKGKWQAWAKQAKKRLDLIAEGKGTDPWDTDWDVNKFGWHDLWRSTYKEGKSRRMSDHHYGALRGFAANYWLRRFVPDAFRDRGGKAKVYLAGENPAWPIIYTQKKRLVGIFDPWIERTLWWQLPPSAYEAVQRTIQQPLLRVHIEDQDGRTLGESITGWREAKSSEKPGVPEEVLMYQDSKIGGEDLMVQGTVEVAKNVRPLENRMSKFNCVVALGEGGLLFLPMGQAWDGYKTAFAHVLAPSMVFPYRIRIPAEQQSAAKKTSAKLSLSARPLAEVKDWATPPAHMETMTTGRRR